MKNFKEGETYRMATQEPGAELTFKIPNEQAHQIKIGDELELIIQTKESD